MPPTPKSSTLVAAINPKARAAMKKLGSTLTSWKTSGDGQSGGGGVGAKSKSILDEAFDHVFVWDESTCCVRSVSLKCDDDSFEEVSLVPVETPFFRIDSLKLSPNGKWICVKGPRGLTVIEMPKSLVTTGRFTAPNPRSRTTEKSPQEVVCRSFAVGEKLFSRDSNLVLLQAEWHPGSANDEHLVTLTSDNTLRIFNVFESESGVGKRPPGQHPKQIIPLVPRSGRPAVPARLASKAGLGDIGVSFTFAPPKVPNQAPNLDEGPQEVYWPVFALFANGNVFWLLTGLGENAVYRPEVVGPLSMYPEMEDNYGSESCSILCLKSPAPSNPTVLAIANNCGTLYHAVVLTTSGGEGRGRTDLPDDQDDDEEGPRSRSGNPDETMSLYVFESIEIDLAFAPSAQEDEAPAGCQPECPISLVAADGPSSLSSSRYFCLHRAGVHCVGLPLLCQMAWMLPSSAPGDEEKDDDAMFFEEDSVVEHLVCTQLNPREPPAPVLGLAVSSVPFKLLVLLHDYSLECLTLSKPSYLDKVPQLLSDNLNEVSSKEALVAESSRDTLLNQIKRILHRNASHPLVKGPTDRELGDKECLDILMRSKGILREEYVVKMEKAQSELERRIVVLESRKKNQLQLMERLLTDRKALKESASKLAEEYEELFDKNERLTNRVEMILEKIQHQMPVRSDAELRMSRKMQEIERSLKDFATGIEQLRLKDRFQLRQIRESKDRLGPIHKTVGSASEGSESVATPSPARPFEGEENQLASIKEVLQTNSKELAQLVKTVNVYKSEIS